MYFRGMKMLKSFKNLVFESENTCLFCRGNTANANGYICNFCMDSIEIVNRQIDIHSPYIDRVYYACIYNRFIRENLHSFKFEGKPYLYKAFGEILLIAIDEIKLEERIDAIIYVPMHRRKEAQRGYNQSELLAEFVADNLDMPLLKNHLFKRKLTTEQNKLNRLDRLTNLKDSFTIKTPLDLKDKEILLIDDIITTGSTMEECAKTLREAGTKNIYGLALTSGMRK